MECDHHDSPVFFEAAGHDLFGIFTTPSAPANGMAVLTLWGGNEFPTCARNRVRNRLADELAAAGFHVLRIDYRGIGESGGEVRTPDLTVPWDDDVVGATRWLHDNGFDQVLVVGTCFGARSTLAGSHRIPNLAGMLLASIPVGVSNHREAIIDQPMRWYLKRAISPGSIRLILGGSEQARRRRGVMKARLRRLLRPSPGGQGSTRRSDANDEFLGQLQDALGRGIPVKFLYGTQDDFFASFERSLAGPLGRVIDGSHGLADVEILDTSLGAMHSLESQDAFVTASVEWAVRMTKVPS